MRWTVVVAMLLFASALVLEGTGYHEWSLLVAIGALIAAVLSQHEK